MNSNLESNFFRRNTPTYLDYVQKGETDKKGIKIQRGEHNKRDLMPASYVEMCMLQAIMEGWWYSYSGSAAYYGGGQCNFAYNLANWAFYEKQSDPKKEASTSTRGLVGSTYTIGGKLTKVPANQIEKAQKGNILYNNSLKHMALRGGEFITADLQYYESTALQFAHVKDDDKHTGAIALPLKDNASKPAINQFVKYGVMKKIDLTK